jgi:hypothetical protein
MKIKITKIYEEEVDLDAEIKRIKKEFKYDPNMRDKLLDIIDAFFTKQDLELTNQLYYDLPYDDKKHFCPGQEFMGRWWYKLCDPRNEIDRTIEIVDK